MTPREQMILLKLAVRLAEQGSAAKDADIERELATLLKTRSDTPYLLLKRCMTLELELEEARTRLNETKRTLSPFGTSPYVVQGPDDYKVAPQNGATRSTAPPAGLRNLLGEWASTTLLNELTNDVPPTKGRGRN